MPNEMVERVAHAIRDEIAHENNPGEWCVEGGFRGDDFFRDIARAAIAELLQTTPEQRQAARDIPFTHLVNERNVAIYQAMLRVVLAD